MNLKIENYTILNEDVSYDNLHIGSINYELIGQLNEFKLAKIGIYLNDDYIHNHFLSLLKLLTLHLIKYDNTLKIIYHVDKGNLEVIKYLEEAKYVFSKEVNIKIDEYKITKKMI